MVEMIDIHFDLQSDEIGTTHMDARLRSALLEVPRHRFVPLQLMGAAYQDTPLPIGFDKTLPQPFIAALMIDLLDIGPDDAVLEIGTGLGYQAGVMAQLADHVWSLDVVEEFIEYAETMMLELQYANVTLRVGDGVAGWAEAAPFDRILVTAASHEPPAQLLAQLKPGARMVMPLGNPDAQQISVIDKQADNDITIRRVIPARFTALETI
ncbi:Protein-L-isoaspartate(D-aspartate) O-methyltransferase [Alteripontixanthobacter maritimus]|uniref:Protein-L-isoaspartate O-methyltransferase n=2 Tax=Alteripontixanthobacter maritimus TaxID=2161824 RepID=A0A369Q720_9SPHN|nr:Protein-L-isoaspartate(D-aspartate) O-methyltransferase [Alteripontixanthobacter maritimus]